MRLMVDAENLYRARISQSLVRLRREKFEDGSAMGYVIGVGPVFFLLSVVADYIRFDGFQLLRVEDVTHFECPHRHDVFVERALELRGEHQELDLEVDLGRMPDAIRSISQAFSLITIHREEVEPDVCQIGKVVSVDYNGLVLTEIDPDANWEDTNDTYALAEITRIDFGGQYEDALDTVNRSM